MAQPLPPAPGPSRDLPDYYFVKGGPHGVCGIWVKRQADAENEVFLVTIFASNKLPPQLFDGGYRIAPNRYDANGGCFVMFGSTPAPGEPGGPTPTLDRAQASPPATSPPIAVPTPPPPVNGDSVSDGEFFNPPEVAAAGTLVRGRTKPKRPFNWMRALVITLAVGFSICVVIIAFYIVFNVFFANSGFFGTTSEVRGNLYYGQLRGEKVYKLALLREEWEIDREIKSGFEAHAAWKHKEYDFWFAVHVEDYGSLKPRDAEMLRIAIDKLENYYGVALELAAKAEPAKIGGLAAQKLRFKGQVKAAPWEGECYMFFNNGVGYWLFLAAPDTATVEYFEDALPKKNFFVESERRGWREQAPPTKTFASNNKKFTVTVPEAVWEKHDAKNEDENGELFLFGKYQKVKDNRKNASLLVFAFKKEDDLKTAMKTARDYVNGRIKVDGEAKNYKIVQASDIAEGQTEIGTIENLGNRRGRLIDLKLLFNDEAKPLRYHLLAVVNEPDQAYGIFCDCTWESRQIWRQDFLDVIATLDFKKGE